MPRRISASLTVSGDEGASSLRPQRLLVSVFGAFLREGGGWVPYDGLTRLMSELDVDSKATRSSANRLMRRGFIEVGERKGVSGLQLTGGAREILIAADRRIFRPVEFPDEGKWLIVVFSVPESRRSERHLMRSRLEWLGFGRVTSGVWIAPAHVEGEAVEMLERMELSDYSTLFKSETPAVPDIHAAVHTWWDLDSIAAGYRTFISQHKPLERSVHRRAAIPDEWAYVKYVHMLTYWRRLPFFDPGLPRMLMPDDWVGYDAVAMFHNLHEALSASARRHVRSVLTLPGKCSRAES
jgi:phenylacetic acid degradation operon negative regulatory protein